ncbi:ABC transporter ATP-binding protein [uncultured Sphaerochaeta sp.]|uniref:ABC transporter ATP-binding protein n=1 Tax=uncultured Sphaerochaeta sp. TaxID=886478 RepID=UPI002A0A4A0E|nr:ABC transporter ATP-binding protein [uncultured Sphaerochaeta sp.]
MSLLTMHAIDKSFFGKPANEKVSLEIGYGEIHALLGENGAGKTTLMNILYGMYQRDGGTIELEGELVSFDSPKAAIEHRIGMVHQHFALVPTLTVSQNITLGLKSPGYPFLKRAALDEKIRALSVKYGLEVDPTRFVKDLSIGQQQRVEIIKLLYRDAKLLILDEPTAVLTPQEIQSLFAVLNRLREEDHSVIIITHHIPEVLSITDKITVLQNGRMVGTVNTKETNEEELSRLMIGRKLQGAKREPLYNGSKKDGLVLSSVELAKDRLGPLSLKVFPGSVLGIAGVDGNGQKELAEIILGIRMNPKGSVFLDGVCLDALSVLERKQLGIGYISDDRQNDGLILDMDLNENMMLGVQGEGGLRSSGFLNRPLIQKKTEKAVFDHRIKTSSLDCHLRYLSGGNQQKLILAREMEGNPKLVVACQPTRGLDIGSSETVHNALLCLRQEGCAILLISSDLEELLLLSDDLAVMYGGKIMDCFPNDNIDLTEVGLLMAGKEIIE